MTTSQSIPQLTIPQTMRALVLEAPGELTYQTIPTPQPQPGELLIRVKSATTCGTDLKAYRRGHPQIPMPGTLGHEYSGEVVATGLDAPFLPGQPIMGVHSAPCQQCRWCQNNQENLCESIMATKVLGSYAEYLLIPAHIAKLNVFPKPDSISYDQASLLEPLACVAQALSRVNIQPHHSVLIIGPGAIGLMFVAALRHQNITKITLAGRNQSRLQVGESLGAIPTSLDQLTNNNQKFDFVIECTGQVPIWEKTIQFAHRGATIILFGGCPSGTAASFPTHRLHYDDISLISPFHFGTKAVRQAREWLLHPNFDLTPLISGSISLQEGPAAFQDLIAGKGIKYVFHP